ncbi:hypothetical protein IAU59_005295 [Kwoniella sp. CBS 9459]
MPPYAQSETPSPTPSMAAMHMYETPSLGHEVDPGDAFSPQSPPLETPSLEVDSDDIEQLLDPVPVPLPASMSVSVFAPEGAQHREGVTQAELEGYDTGSLTSHDVDADPILASLAAKQSLSNLKANYKPNNTVYPQLNIANIGTNPTDGNTLVKVVAPKEQASVPFKAKSVPSSTNKEGLGPKMTKSAALRMGLNWEAEKGKSSPSGQRKVEAREAERDVGTPGQKPIGLGITVPSLASPSITPKPTKSSLLRATGERGSGLWPEPSQAKPGDSISSPRKQREDLALANKEKERLERLAKRKSLGINLASLNEPSVVVRQNKTSQLRAAGEVGGGLWPAPGTSSEMTSAKEADKKEREMAALAIKGRERSAREERRKTFSAGIAALAQPTILVKGNRTSKLREAGEKGTELWHEPKFSLATEDEERDVKRERETIALANKARERKAREHRRKTLSISAPIAALSRPTVSVRGNRTSELRATGEIGNGLWPDREAVIRSADGAKTREEVATERKERDKLERLKRRKSFAPPVSLGRPSITPRTTKTSLLRTNSQKSIPATPSASASASGGNRRPRTTTFSRFQSAASLTRTISTSALRATDAVNVERASKITGEDVEYLDEEHESATADAVKYKMALKSLGKPSITPRLNRTVMLRTAGKSSTSITSSSSIPSIHRKAASIATPLVSGSSGPTKSHTTVKTPIPRRPMSSAGSGVGAGSASGFGPRPNKTSLLRAQAQARKAQESK